MSEELGLGKIIKGEQNRDAVHIAVAPVVAAERLAPGRHIGLMKDGRAGTVKNTIGVVDPFLHYEVEPGQKFWMYLYPGSITSLRHEWTHPAMEQGPVKIDTPAWGDKKASEEWLQKFADSWGMGFGEMIEGASERSDHHGIVAKGMDIHSWDELDPGETDLFWQHLENFTGEKFNKKHRKDTYFSCSC